MEERRWRSAQSMAPRFEARWLEEEGCKEVIGETWNREVGGTERKWHRVCGVL